MNKLVMLLGLAGLALLLASLAPWPADVEATVPAPAAAAGQSPLSEVARGQALFLAKGCATCHRHDAWGERSGQVNVGPDLSAYRPDPEWVARWLRDPVAIRPNTAMPNLNLDEQEISALIAFLDAAAGVEDMAYDGSLLAATDGGCPVTQPASQPFTPPDTGSPNIIDDAHFWHGSDALWTQLPRDGVWRGLPHHERGYTQKLFFSRQGYNWIEEQIPALTISGRRLDVAGVSFEEREATNGFHPDVGAFMLVGVDIPTEGCWEITGHYAGNELSYVVWVEPDR